MPCINAVSFHEYSHIEGICRVVREAGFDAIELSRPHFYERLTTAETRRAFVNWCDSIGLSLRGFDCWVEVEPFDAFDETLADFGRSVEFATALNLGTMISHDTWAHTNGSRSASDVLKANVRLFRRVAELTTAQNLKLVFEPHPDTLSMDNAWCVDFIDAVADGFAPGSVGILYDSCHYGVGQPDSYVEAIEILGRRIQHIHFADGDTQTYALHLPAGDGCLDLSAVTDAFQQIEFDGTLTCDMYNYPLLQDGARRSVDAICEAESALGLG